MRRRLHRIWLAYRRRFLPLISGSLIFPVLFRSYREPLQLIPLVTGEERYKLQ